MEINGYKKKSHPAQEIPFDPERQTAILKCSICNGERVAGFRDRRTGHFTEAAFIRDDAELAEFLERYGLETIAKEY